MSFLGVPGSTEGTRIVERAWEFCDAASREMVVNLGEFIPAEEVAGVLAGRSSDSDGELVVADVVGDTIVDSVVMSGRASEASGTHANCSNKAAVARNMIAKSPCFKILLAGKKSTDDTRRLIG